jgi:hypothetical protein
VGLVGSVRAVEQTPEMAFLVRAVPLAYPEARVVHIVRDGRDVVCSLLEKPWLRAEQAQVDDAGVPYGAYARFWVEPERRAEFETASETRRAAWAWRSYLTAARGAEAFELRYEDLVSDPARVGTELAGFLDASADRLVDALGHAHGGSVGRYQRELDAEELAEVQDEAGTLLRELGYVSSASA